MNRKHSLLCLLLAVCLLALAGCGKESVPAADDDTISTPIVRTAAELVGLSGAEIIALYGDDYTAVTPEGDPPYFFYENLGHVPFRFIGEPDDAYIRAVSSNVTGTEMLDVICIGDSLASMEKAAIAMVGYEYFPADNWYDDGNGVYGWAHVMGQGRQYSCYIMNEVLTSFECRLWDE